MSRVSRHELELGQQLRRRGYGFAVHARPTPACRSEADILFSSARVAVSIDGCFWHSCPLHGRVPARDESFWRDKLLRTRVRDAEAHAVLERAGWYSVRIWEHESLPSALDRITAAVAAPMDRASFPAMASHRCSMRRPSRR